MRISASQINTFESCRRFWFFQKIEKLSDGPPQAHFTFGTVLHAVCERWLEGEEMYPDGWTETEERDGSTQEVTPKEAKMIQKLVDQAIDEGVLTRRDGTQVERELLVPIIEGVELIGFIDVYRSPGPDGLPVLEDHKTFSKGSLRYIMNEKPDSPHYLGKNQQLKTYAWASSELDGYSGDVRLRHNQFPKFPNRDVSKAEAVLPELEIANHGEYLRAVAGDMKRTGQIKEWGDVPGPSDSSKCSRWYGKPCPFAGICGRIETVDGYRLRTEQESEAIREGTVLPDSPTSLNTVMSLFDNVRRPGGDINGAPAPEPAPSRELPVDAEPWANADCTACDGSGRASSGRACQMCEAVTKRNGGQSASDVALDGPAEPAPAPAPEPAPEPAPAPAPRRAPSTERGVRVYIGSIPRGEDYIDSSQLLARLGAQLAKDMGAEDYWSLDTFKRRERLQQRAGEIVASLAGKSVVHIGVLGNDDVGSLVRALISETEGVDLVVVAVA